MNVITLQEHLDNSNLTDGLNLEYQKYVMKLILLLRRKLTEGSIMDAEKIRAELKLIVDNKTGINTNITPQLKGEIIVLFIELRVKTRATKDLKQHLEELKYLLMKMKDKEQKSIVYKVNCMILFNMEFEGFQNFIEHEDRTAVAFYKNGKFTKAVQILQRMLNTNSVEYHSMRKVWIGRILMQSYDLSAFTWLYEVINNSTKFEDKKQNQSEINNNHTRNGKNYLKNIISGTIQKYEAKLLFTSGFKVLCERKGKDPQIAGVVGIHEKSVQYSNEIQKMKLIRDDMREFNKLKIILDDCNEDYKIKNILQALQVLDKISSVPKPSLEELDLRIKLLNQYQKAKRHKEARKQAGRCKAIADDLGVFSWDRKNMIQKIANKPLKDLEQTKMTDSNHPSEDQSTRAIQKGDLSQHSRASSFKKNNKPITYKAALNDQKAHIVFKDKDKTKQLQVQNIQDLQSSDKSKYSQSKSRSKSKSKSRSRSKSKSQSQSSQSQSQQQDKENKEKKLKQKKLNRLSRQNYEFHRKTLDDKRRSMLEQQPHCCLIF